jgi:hypothetical protein
MTQNAKTRSLRKYEAGATPVATLPGPVPLELYSPFGPMIAKARLPDALIASINAHADQVVSPHKSTEFLLPENLVNRGGDASLAGAITQLIQRYLAAMEDTKVEAVDFEVFWVVSQYAGTPSPVHFHSSDLSGVLYLKLPEIDAAEEAKTYISGRQAGQINFIIGGKQRFAKSLISFKPQVGDFYIFPGWLLHVAEPFAGSGERRSMSFNASVKAAEG